MRVFEAKTYQCAECLSVMEWIVLSKPTRRFILRHPAEWMSGIGDCPNMNQQVEITPEPIDVSSQCVLEHPYKTAIDLAEANGR